MLSVKVRVTVTVLTKSCHLAGQALSSGLAA